MGAHHQPRFAGVLDGLGYHGSRAAIATRKLSEQPCRCVRPTLPSSAAAPGVGAAGGRRRWESWRRKLHGFGAVGAFPGRNYTVKRSQSRVFVIKLRPEGGDYL